MPNLDIKLKPETLRSLDFGDIDVNYTDLGTAFGHPIVLFHIINDLDEDILVSFFGGIDHLFVKAGSFTLYDVAANREEPAGARMFEKGTIIQVKSAVGLPASGSVYLTVFYATGS